MVKDLLSICVGPSVCQLVKMLITLKLHGIFRSNYAYIYMYIIPLSDNWYANLSIFCLE